MLVPAAVGVPERMPLDEFKLMPAGGDPVTMDQA